MCGENSADIFVFFSAPGKVTLQLGKFSAFLIFPYDFIGLNSFIPHFPFNPSPFVLLPSPLSSRFSVPSQCRATAFVVTGLGPKSNSAPWSLNSYVNFCRLPTEKKLKFWQFYFCAFSGFLSRPGTPRPRPCTHRHSGAGYNLYIQPGQPSNKSTK